MFILTDQSLYSVIFAGRINTGIFLAMPVFIDVLNPYIFMIIFSGNS